MPTLPNNNLRYLLELKRTTCNLMKVILQTRPAHYSRYLHFYYYHWVDPSAGGILVTEGIINPVVSDSITGSIPQLVEY